jgi:hypothetical protein
MTAPNLLAASHRQPPPDPELSPYTGYTRAHWEAAADRMLAALLPYASPHRAQYRLPGRTSHSGVLSDGLEGYARSFTLAACRIAGAGGRDEPGSTLVRDLVERYAAGLAAGTDPAGPERWPAITDRAQSMVEAAAIAIALHETRPWLWDTLPDAVRQHVADWLGGFVGARPNDSNWRLFQVVTEEFLASVGRRTAGPRSTRAWPGSTTGTAATAGTPTATGRSSTTTTPGRCTSTPSCGPVSPGRAPTACSSRPTANACGASWRRTSTSSAPTARPSTRAAP